MSKSIANVIGNGYSQKYYNTQDSFTVTCNTNTNTPHDVVSVIDHQPIDFWAQQQYTPQTPIWCSVKAQNSIQQHKIPADVECVHNSTVKYNNAQCVVLELLKRGFTTIHIYGCDSIWSEDMTSTQDHLIPRPHRNRLLYVMWRDLWQQIFANNIQIDFYIHSPTNTPTPNLGKNVFWWQHLELDNQSNK